VSDEPSTPNMMDVSTQQNTSETSTSDNETQNLQIQPERNTDLTIYVTRSGL